MSAQPRARVGATLFKRQLQAIRHQLDASRRQVEGLGISSMGAGGCSEYGGFNYSTLAETKEYISERKQHVRKQPLQLWQALMQVSYLGTRATFALSYI